MKFTSTIKLFIVLLILVSNNVPAQKQIKISNLKSKFAIEKNKNKYYANLINNIESVFKTPVEQNLNRWNKAFKDAESILLKSELVKNALRQSLSLPADKYLKLQRTTLEVAFALYQNDFIELVNRIFNNTNDKLSYAISVNYLMRANYKNRTNKYYIDDLQNRFTDFRYNGLLKNLVYDLKNPGDLKFKHQPGLRELLNHPFQKGKTIVYTFLRKNRLHPGITLIKKPDGSFVKNSDGSLFHIPQLALSYSNLPGYISNGNTPEGIYSIIGWYISPTETIGPTPNLLVRSPFEVSPDIFFHNKNKSNRWNIEDYTSLLPGLWKNYFPVFQSFYAGKSGRKLIIIHGSTDELKYFEDQPYFPLIPTRGCLSSIEIWDDKTGKCIKSDQAKLINAFKSTRQRKGFLIVVELDGKETPVTIEEIEKLIE